MQKVTLEEKKIIANRNRPRDTEAENTPLILPDVHLSQLNRRPFPAKPKRKLFSESAAGFSVPPSVSVSSIHHITPIQEETKEAVFLLLC